MVIVPIHDFSGGMAEDYGNGQPSEFSFSSHFDILSYPHRLQPLRGMTIDTASTGGTNLFVASDGLMYASGWKTSAHTTSALWQRDSGTIGAGGYGSGDGFKEMVQSYGSGSYGTSSTGNLLLEYPDVGDTRTLVYNDTAGLIRVDPADSDAKIVNTLTFATMGQGLVHPTDAILYLPYKLSDGSNLIGRLPNGVGASAVTTAVLTLSKKYRVYCLSSYGNYLAIPATGRNNNYGSVVYLWDRVATTWNETIPWGAGDLQVLNNLNGALIGVSHRSTGVTGTTQDSDGIEIKIYQGGSDPVLIKQINQNTLSTGNISMTINSGVNFVKNNRLYFSLDIIPNDGSTARRGLWSVGKNRNGRWIVTCERTENNTGLSILAAAMQGDFLSVVSNAAGTVYSTTYGTTGPSTYGATSIYESCVNPNMSQIDRAKNKKLISIYVNVAPIVGGTLTVKYKVDDTTQGGNWVACGTYSTTGGTTLDIRKPTTNQFKDGKYYEFQISSTGGVVVNDWGYEYLPLKIKK